MVFSFSNQWGQVARRAAKISLLLGFFLGIYFLYHQFTTPELKAYRVGMDARWHPLALHGKEPETTAFSMELLSEIARDQAIPMEIVRTSQNRLLEVLDDKVVDGILTSLPPDGAGNEKYAFSDPYYEFGAILVVLSDSDINTLKDLEGKRLGVHRDSSVLYRFKLNCQVSVIPFDNFPAMLEALIAGKVDAVLMDQLLQYLYYGVHFRDQIQAATEPLTQEGLRLATLKSPEGLAFIEKFNAGLQHLKEKGIYENLSNEWEVYQE